MKKDSTTPKNGNAGKITSERKLEVHRPLKGAGSLSGSRYKVRVSDRTFRRLNLAAKLRQCTIQAIIRTAVATFLECEDDVAGTDKAGDYRLRPA
jgi:hypothetical protein